LSTAERDHYKIAACPCGQGDITRHVTSWDNPWSGVDVSYSIDCAACASRWSIDSSGATLTDRKSEVESRRAWSVYIETSKRLDEYLRPLALRYVAGQDPRSKKAEHALLTQLGIYRGSYQSYLKDRQRSPLQDVCRLSANPEFTVKIVTTYGDAREYKRLRNALDQSEAERDAAASKVVRRSVR